MKIQSRWWLLLTSVLISEVPCHSALKTNVTLGERAECDPLANIFVINLEGKRGEARRAEIRKEFEKAGIHKYTLWPATDRHTDIHYQQLLKAGESILKKDGHSAMTDGEAALALSHQRIYKHVIDKKLACALVFEDDARLTASFANRLSSLRAKLTMPFDWIKTDWNNKDNGSPTGPADQSSMPHLEDGDGQFASGYIVSAAGARLLIDANTPLWMNADGIMDPTHLKSSLAANERPNSQPRVYHVVPELSWQGNWRLDGGKMD